MDKTHKDVKVEYEAPELVLEGDLSKVTKENGGGFSA
jgi:hypothetical protein